MPKLVTYQCPDCSGHFDFMHHPVSEPPPDRCPLCNAWMGSEPEKLPVLHLNIGTHKGRTPDVLYRRMEAASIARAEEAAEVAGVDVSEMSELKMTDMQDNLREGDTTNKARINTTEAATRLAQFGAKPEMQQINKDQVQGYIGETTSGPTPLRSRSVITDLQRSGRGNAILASATRNGQMGKF